LIGSEAEQLASDFLSVRGLKVIERNFRSPVGEIDLIAKDGVTTVFVEVRFRKNLAFGTPAETIGYHKRRKIVSTALYYLQREKLLDSNPSRFDVVSVTLGKQGAQFDWIPNAFGEAG